ncbi:unnamed protein product [Linum tenue]|uniref:Uncharacterized protein n=1 Tax=Linum tenue TaxID=586396 RepID=A0AAV0NED9_9ROSI|nr:unnamed protein product [Linum tenue]
MQLGVTTVGSEEAPPPPPAGARISDAIGSNGDSYTDLRYPTADTYRQIIGKAPRRYDYAPSSDDECDGYCRVGAIECDGQEIRWKVATTVADLQRQRILH